MAVTVVAVTAVAAATVEQPLEVTAAGRLMPLFPVNVTSVARV
jgi:hypothetical protein